MTMMFISHLRPVTVEFTAAPDDLLTEHSEKVRSEVTVEMQISTRDAATVPRTSRGEKTSRCGFYQDYVYNARFRRRIYANFVMNGHKQYQTTEEKERKNIYTNTHCIVLYCIVL